jgi:hypothetical protein
MGQDREGSGEVRKMTETRVTINTWLTKASLRNCKAYLDQLNVPTLERALEALLKVKETKKVPEWRHYCGEKPRYWYISVQDDGTITFEGGHGLACRGQERHAVHRRVYDEGLANRCYRRSSETSGDVDVEV